MLSVFKTIPVNMKNISLSHNFVPELLGMSIFGTGAWAFRSKPHLACRHRLSWVASPTSPTRVSNRHLHYRTLLAELSSIRIALYTPASMVLEDVKESSSDKLNENPYPNPNDPYASSTSMSASARFDASNMPQPLPVLGQFMGFSDRAVRAKTEATLKFAERKIGRQLNPDEAHALAFQLYQLEQTKSYYAAGGALAGAYRAYSTMATNKYPFYQPKPEDINPNKFAFIRGPMAQVARHTWRFSLYMLLAGQFGDLIGQVVAQPRAAANTSTDPKLEQFGIELKAAVASDEARAASHGRDIHERRRELERQARDKSGMGPSPQSGWGKQSRVQSQEDDMSPTAGNESWGTQPSSSGSWDSYSSTDDQNTTQNQQVSSSSESWNRQTQTHRPTQSPSSSLPFYDDDDASPTGGMFQEEVKNSASREQQQSRPGESAWERLRRGGTPIAEQRPPQPPQQARRAEPERREQREGSSLGDSFTFVEGDAERKKERERAQQEFDARIERERQGKDFNSDEGKRW